MPFIFKDSQETNPHLWSLSYFLQNSSSSNIKVKMEDDEQQIDEQLKISIRSILNAIPEETINGIIHAVKYAGLESLSDLQFVQEEDLILVLKPIQRRKLIKAWSEPNIPAVKLLSNLPLQKCKWKRKNYLMLLQVYAKYKTELSCPDTEKHEMWGKIADEIKEKCSLNCDELQCMDKIEELRHEYEILRKKNSFSKQDADFFYEAQNAFENIKNPVISPASTSNRRKCKWNSKNSLKLLEVCAKYKTELACPDVEEHTVWKKIADELRKLIHLRCDELDCRKKIGELRCEYERIKNNCVTDRTTAIFLDEARKVFETFETPVNISAEQSSSISLLNCKKKTKSVFHQRLLEVYAKYKNEFSCSGIEEEKVWEKIAKEIRERYSYNCGAFLCRFELSELKHRYESLKKECSKNLTIDVEDFLDVAKEAFETSENLDILNSQVNETKKVGKYVPPHLRNDRNKSESVMVSKIEVISPVGTSDNLAVQKCKWNQKKSLSLLKVYMKYKREFSYPGVEEQTVWKKIADELRKSIFLRCDELECCNKIDELRSEYERIKNECITDRKTAIFLDEAKKAFEAIEIPINITAEQSSNTTFLSCTKRKSGFHLRLLQVYAKYKNELSYSDINKEKVWEKIATQIREKYSYNCGPFLCRFDLSELKCQYKNSKNMIDMEYLFDDAREAFEISENIDILDSQVNEVKKIGKYMPPHLRNEGNKSESVMAPKIEDKPFTIKVSNLSKDVKESDLQELFTPYGTIADIYTIKDTPGQSKWFAFIKFHKTEDATRAIEAVNGVEYNKSILKVEWARRSEQRETTDHDFPMQSIKVTNRVPSLPPFNSAVKPSKFNMNAFKKVYSNEVKGVSIKYFWDNFDAENYSIWFCEYLYPNQLTLTFMSCNLIVGMFQRLYQMGKNAFASVCLFGEDNNSTISGIWVWGGHDLAFILSPAWQVDYESYSWKKLDPSSEETKKLVNEYFTWSGEFGGKKFNQGKIFK